MSRIEALEERFRAREEASGPAAARDAITNLEIELRVLRNQIFDYHFSLVERVEQLHRRVDDLNRPRRGR